MPHLWELVPNAEVLIALEPEELGGILLRSLATRQNQNMFHPNSFDNELFDGHVSRYPHEKRHAVLGAVREAFAWLEGQALIVGLDASNTQAGWRVLSRRGRRLSDSAAWKEYQKANLLPKALLHKQVSDAVYFDFLRGDYQSAVFKAFREVEIAVSEAAKLPGEVGVRLMRVAFSPSPKAGYLTDSTAEGGEQQALSDLFAGAIGSYKNPHSHRRVALDAGDAVEMLILASHLLRIVDARRPA